MIDKEWISRCTEGVAAGALDLLGDIVEAFDMADGPTIVISPYVDGMGVGREDEGLEMRMQMARALIKHGVLKNAVHFHANPFGAGPREGIRIEADEEVVREAHRLFDERLFGAPRPRAKSPDRVAPAAAATGRVFIVCGRDDAATQAVARFLETMGVKPVILAEQTNKGRTIIEKLEEHATSDYAVVILTPDDEGRLHKDGEVLRPRPRQNVVGELFYFTAKLGRSRVCALKKGEMELPSDYDGFGYTPMDAHDGWKLKLAREMKDAGIKADYDKII